MAQYAPDGTLLEVLDEGEEGEEQQNPESALQGEEEDCGGAGNGQGNGCSGPPYHMRGHSGQGVPGGARQHGSIRGYDLEPPIQPNILDQLVAAQCDAGLQANPTHQRRCRPDLRYPGRRNPHGIEDNNSDEEEDGPRVKIPPLIFKGLPREWPNAHLLAAEDWMEVM